MAACSQNVPCGPSTATRCGASSARQADMISRQMEATCWLSNGPWLAAWIFSMTWATRSGRKKGEPSARLISPTCSATRARWLSSDSNCWSSESIWTRRAPRASDCVGCVMASGPGFLEIAHVAHQRLHARQRQGVVEAGAHGADRFVAPELQQVCGLPASQAGPGARLVAQEKRHVHARAAVSGHLVDVQLRLVDEVVEQGGFGQIALLHGRHTAELTLGLA